MLETVNLVKIYKTKGGAQVTALDGVSLQFPESGMVFLLGKSGSGKSTLLNVCGGLDSPSSGEIIVKGRSSKDFTQSDFDSYRNTFIGFVFQEYNILNEFSVEDNIALALELQGKNKDKETIKRILEEVDLSGYAKRNPNTLSGGQKQRIAIARALVKNPEIIMADEPTGALDSTTGKQVFDTLKKLSKNKLVIVVSHDRDFAEQYGDRIIELRDGKVISDVSKTSEKSLEISDNLTISEDIICVKSGANLSDKDFLLIKDFLSSSKSEIVLANGKKDVQNFKQISRISNDGVKEVFKETEIPKDKKSYSKEDSHFIKSRLPARHALKMGVSGLKIKPVRLFFTILLCTISFIMFGLLSTMMVYDSDKVLKNSLMSSDYTSLNLKKQYKVTYTQYENEKATYSYDGLEDTKFTKAEVTSLTEKFGTDTFGVKKIDNTIASQISGIYYSPTIYYAVSVSDAKNFTVLQGTLPTKDDEICISSYTAESLISGQIFSPETNNFFKAENENQLIGKKINLNDSTFTISGIWKSSPIPQKYNDINSELTNNYKLRFEYQNELISGLFTAAIFSDKYFSEKITQNDQEKDIYNEYFKNSPYYVMLQSSLDPSHTSATSKFVNFDNVNNKLPMYFIDSSKKNLADNEVVIGSFAFYDFINEAVNKKLEELQDDSESYTELYNSFFGDKYEDDGKGNSIISDYSIRSKLEFLSCNQDYDNNILTNEQKEQYISDVFGFINTTKYGIFPLSIQITEPNAKLKTITANVVGLFLHEYSTDVVFSPNNYEEFYLAAKNTTGDFNYHQEQTTRYVMPQDAIYDSIFISFHKSESEANTIVSLVGKYSEDDSIINLKNTTAENLKTINDMVENFSNIFLWFGIVLAIFSALLLCNFISVSISHKRREIGILRAVGARSFDVFKIFFSESFVITIICVLLSIIGGIVVCGILNNQTGEFLSNITLFVFGVPSILMVVLVSFLTAIIATFFPVYFAAKKKPVDSIRAI